MKPILFLAILFLSFSTLATEIKFNWDSPSAYAPSAEFPDGKPLPLDEVVGYIISTCDNNSVKISEIAVTAQDASQVAQTYTEDVPNGEMNFYCLQAVATNGQTSSMSAPVGISTLIPGVVNFSSIELPLPTEGAAITPP